MNTAQFMERLGDLLGTQVFALGDVRVTVGSLLTALLIVLGLYALNALLKAVNNYYVTLPVSGSRPIKGYLQVVMIVASVFGAVVAVARLADQSVGSSWVALAP